LKPIIALQIQKRDSIVFKDIQDKFALSVKDNVFALSDGTTQGFESGIWAELLVNAFVNYPTFKIESLLELFLEQVKVFDSMEFEFSKNPAIAALELSNKKQGASATFLGIKIYSSFKIDVISCGDTNLFLIRQDGSLLKFPHNDIHSLDSSSKFINSINLSLGDINESFFDITSFKFQPTDILIMATDALSKLILNEPEVLQELLLIHSFDEFLAFCSRYWDSKKLQEDDITALIIPLHNSEQVKYVIPPSDFSFIQKNTSSICTPYSKTTESSMENNEIRDQIKNLNQSLLYLKSKSKTNEFLMYLIMGLTICNLLFLSLQNPISIWLKRNRNVMKIENIELKIPNKDTEYHKKKTVKTLKNKTNNSAIDTLSVKHIINSNSKYSSTLLPEEIKQRQIELKEAGYNIALDGIWGKKSEIAWNDYENKRSNKK
jgi:serine/threonine protein phosphatase PrpC